jgi:hypothetical protein
VPQSARALGCDQQTVRNAIHAVTTDGLAALTPGSPVAHTIHRAFDGETADQLPALVPQRPRSFGKPTSLCTLGLAAEISFQAGLTSTRVRGETVRATRERWGVRGTRAKRWITSPDPAYADPAYARKKGLATA